MDQKILRDALNRAGLNTYENHDGAPAVKAQTALAGRTHYAEPATLRWHFARITSARPISMGAFFLIVESCAADYENTRRVFRTVCFDIFGTVIYRPDLDASSTSTEAANKAFWTFWDNFNEAEYYAEELKSRARRASEAEVVFNVARFYPHQMPQTEKAAA